jgi:hypothetical protein
MFGPRSNNDWWPCFVTLKALAQYPEAPGDSRMVPFVVTLFCLPASGVAAPVAERLGQIPLARSIAHSHLGLQPDRDAKLLELARLLHSQGYDWTGEFARFP